ncbi:AAA family ATPase, partial [Vibrio sp. 10N.222.55.E8]
GKTTIATNLAVSLSRHYSVLLADANSTQASASDWYEAGGQEYVDCVSVDNASMIKSIKRVGSNYDFVVIDTSPTKNELAAACITESNLVLMPVQPSPYDLWACADLVSLIKQRQQITNGQPLSKFVINAAKVGTNSFQELRSEIEEYGIKRMKSVLYRRESYIKTATLGSGVVMSNDTKAKSEFEGLYQEVLEILK